LTSAGGACTEAGFIGAAFQADGAYASGWGILAGGTFERASIEAVMAGRTQMRRESGNLSQDGPTKTIGRVCSSACVAKNGLTANDVDQLLFTQISKLSIAIAAERCGVPFEKCHTIMEKYGYIGSACIPMALDDAIELGKIKRNMAKAPRCGARTRTRRPCRQAAVRGPARCRMNGGAKGSGGPSGAQNGNFKHGLWTRENKRLRNATRRKLREVRRFLREL
jgi:3-Oxoacyl-[acyl-carrier-protein (ACP)] synthase III C terminal